jgi:uncharacterized membrane protein
MKTFLKPYLLTLLPFILLDALWLGLVAPAFYRSQIGFIMAASPNWLAAILFYLLFIAGMMVFVTGPGIREGNLKQAALRGAFFGLVTYATYDLTNLATLEGWPLLMTVVDMAWGTFLGGITATAAVWLGRKTG